MMTREVEEAARLIELLTGVPAGGGGTDPVRTGPARFGGRGAEKARLARFRRLPPELQEGCLRYAERMLGSYKSKEQAL